MKSARNRGRKKARFSAGTMRLGSYMCAFVCSCTGSGDYRRAAYDVGRRGRNPQDDKDDQDGGDEGGKPLLFWRSSSSRGRHTEEKESRREILDDGDGRRKRLRGRRCDRTRGGRRGRRDTTR